MSRTARPGDVVTIGAGHLRWRVTGVAELADGRAVVDLEPVAQPVRGMRALLDRLVVQEVDHR